MKYTYSTLKNKKGIWRIRHWFDEFKDEDTGEVVKIAREEPIKLNGQKIRFYSDSEIQAMTPKEKRKIFGKFK